MKSALFLSVLFGILIYAFNAEAMEAFEEPKHSHPAKIRLEDDLFLRKLNEDRDWHREHGRLIGAFLRKQYPPTTNYEGAAYQKSEEALFDGEKTLFDGYLVSQAAAVAGRREEGKDIFWLLSISKKSRKEVEEAFSTKFRGLLLASHSLEINVDGKMKVFIEALKCAFGESVGEAYEASRAPLAAPGTSQPPFSFGTDILRGAEAGLAQLSGADPDSVHPRPLTLQRGVIKPKKDLKPEFFTVFNGTRARISVFNPENRPWGVSARQKVTLSCHCDIPADNQGMPRCSLNWYEGTSLSETVNAFVQALRDGENSVGALVPDDIPGVVITGVVPAFFNASPDETRFLIRNIGLLLEPGPKKFPTTS